MPKLLVVDDDADIRRVIERLFSQEFEVSTAGCLAEARELLKNENFEVVIIDRTLIGPDGREERGEDLLSCCDVGDASCVLITGHATPDERAEMLELGFLYVVMKPFEIRELQAVVRRAYRHYVTRAELQQAQELKVSVVSFTPESVSRLRRAAESFRMAALQAVM